MHAPTYSHQAVIKRIMFYLKGMTFYDFYITCNSCFALHDFKDADQADSIDDQKSTGGYLVFFGQMPISQKSGKQRTVVRSSTEDEYKALADSTIKVIQFQYLLTYLQIPSTSALNI